MTNGDENIEYMDEGSDAEDLDIDVVETDEIFTKEEIFGGLNAPFEIKATLQIKDLKTKKIYRKRARMILRIPQGNETGAILRRCKNMSNVDFQDKMAYKVFVNPSFSSEEIKRLPQTFKAKILDIISERCGGVTMSDINRKEADNF